MTENDKDKLADKIDLRHAQKLFSDKQNASLPQEQQKDGNREEDGKFYLNNIQVNEATYNLMRDIIEVTGKTSVTETLVKGKTPENPAKK